MTKFDEDDEWSPWYFKRFWRSKAVARMSDSAALLYKYLLDYQWEHEHLEPPDAMRKLVPGRWAARWGRLWKEIQEAGDDGPLFVADDKGALRNTACAHERAISMQIRRSNSERASRGGKARARRLAEDALEACSKRASSTAPSTQQAELGASTVPYRTEPDREPTPTPPAGRGDLDRLVRAIQTVDPAAGAFTANVAEALRREGLEVELDARIPDRGDGRGGVIALRVVDPPAWIELGRDAVREKSLDKLRSAPPGLRVLVLRSGPWGPIGPPLPKGIDAIVGLGLVEAPAPTGPPPRAEKPLWSQLGYPSEHAYREAERLKSEPKPSLLAMLHAQRSPTSNTQPAPVGSHETSNAALVSAGGSP